MRSLRFLIIVTAALGMFFITSVQAQQRLVLFEEFTQWNCPPCGTTNPGLEKVLYSKYKNVIHIWYHDSGPDANDDPMYLWTPATNDIIGRQNYNNLGYTHSGIPAGALDGAALTPSGGYTGSPQDTAYDDQALTTAQTGATPLSLAISESEPDNSGSVNVHIVANSTQALSGNYVLRVAVVKAIVDSAHMPGNPYRNPEVEFPNVVQRMLPDFTGTSFSIAANGQQSFDLTYNLSDIMPTGNSSRVFIVAWVQNDANKQIVNAGTDYYPVVVSPGTPTLQIAAPSATSTLTQDVKNSSALTATIVSSFSASVPNAWQAGYTVNGTAAPVGTSDTITLDAGQTASYKGNIVMTGGKGLGNGTLSLNETIGDTGFMSTYQIYSISNDVNTLFIDGTDNTNRTSAYTASLNAASKKYNSIAVAATKDISPTLLAQDPSLRTAFFSDADDQGPDPNNIAALANFAQQGGNIVVASNILATIGYIYTANYGVTFYSDFLRQILHTSYVGEASNMYTVSTYSSDTVGKGVNSSISTTAQNPNLGIHFYPDIIKPSDASAKSMLEYTGSGFSTDSVCGVRYQGAYKSVYLSFPLETLTSSSARNTLMQNILTWFNGDASSSAVNEPTATPATDFSLVQNYPNPFSATTNIQFTLPQDENVTLNVYDMKGALVSTLVNGMLHSGPNSITFDGSNLATGMYEYRLTTPTGTLTHLMSLVKQ